MGWLLVGRMVVLTVSEAVGAEHSSNGECLKRFLAHEPDRSCSAAAVRLVTPSLRYAFSRCLRAVCTVTYSSSATSLLEVGGTLRDHRQHPSLGR